MLQIVKYVQNLHQKGFILGAPIENCLVLDKNKPLFFYCCCISAIDKQMLKVMSEPEGKVGEIY